MMGARQCDLFPFTLSIFSIAAHFEESSLRVFLSAGSDGKADGFPEPRYTS